MNDSYNNVSGPSAGLMQKLENLVDDTDALIDGYLQADAKTGPKGTDFFEVSREAQAECRAILSAAESIEKMDWDAYSKLWQKARLANAVEERDRYLDTLKTDLMMIKRRYVLTDGALVSPAGFHPDERVYIRTRIASEHATMDGIRLAAHAIRAAHPGIKLYVTNMLESKSSNRTQAAK